MIWIWRAIERSLWRVVARRYEDQTCTVRRVQVSKHVEDLRFVVDVAGGLAVASIIIVLLLVADAVVQWTPFELKATEIVKAVVEHLAYIGAILGALGAVIAWAYQTASARLGVVDLFACEIGTLCRANAAVDIGEILANRYEHPPEPPAAEEKDKTPATGEKDKPKDPAQFTSQEDYFPVFTANSRDLQTLEADVVVHITAFYTYVKVFRDYSRKLSVTPPPSNGAIEDTWRETLKGMIYMLFLSLESARFAIHQLIEFQPLQTECKIAILVTEIRLYRFLLEKMEHDFRYDRLLLRRPEYKDIVSEICQSTKSGAAETDGIPAESLEPWQRRRKRSWDQSDTSLKELKKRYKDLEASVPLTLPRPRSRAKVEDVSPKRQATTVRSPPLATAT